MKVTASALTALALMLTLAGPAFAGLDGKALYQNACTSCHTTQVHTRKDRKIHSLSGLRKQVAGCAKSNDAGWSKAERRAVVQYLNDQFYAFE